MVTGISEAAMIVLLYCGMIDERGYQCTESDGQGLSELEEVSEE